MIKKHLGLYLVLCLCVGRYFPPSEAQEEAETEAPKVDDTSTVYLYRVVNWCIVGRGEYELNEWPFSQFRPFLLRDHKVREFADNFNRKSKDKEPTTGSYLEPQIDIKFHKIKCEETKDWLGEESGEFLQRVHLKLTSNQALEGVIIQGVHAPFGFGFPFGQFDVDSEFKCSDCKHAYTSKIGCITRPGLSLLHPTVGAFHHEDMQYVNSNYTSNDTTTAKHGRKSELHWNFKWHDSLCSSARVVEFWVMIVLSFGEKVWFTKKFGPYDFHIDPAERIKTKSSPDDKTFVQPDLPTPIFPSCVNRCNYTFLQNGATFKECPFEHILPGNVVCETTGEYNFRHIGSAGGGNNNKAGLWSPSRFPGDFDVDCVEKYPTKSQPYKVCKIWQAKFYCQASDVDITLSEPQLLNSNGNQSSRIFPNSFCQPCTTKAPTPAPKLLKPKLGLIKRTYHTIIMILSFFFILPLSTFTIRFYKETLHTMEYKGWRLWMLLHVSTNMFILLLCYASYSVVTFWKFDGHMYTGYGTTFAAIGAFISGWGRHKNVYVKWFFILVHQGCGYVSYGLALASFIIHRRVGQLPKYCAMFSCGLSIVAILIMTFHVYIIDQKLGVIPDRPQIPIVDIRFDDIFPPGHKFRLIFLGVYAVLLLIVCSFMVCLE